MSLVPPGANGTISRTGLVGYACASALAGNHTAINATSAQNSLANIFPSLFLVLGDE
jgi:hypothetical protein